MRRTLLVVVVAIASLTGCASDPVAWTDRYCAALVTLGTSVGPTPSGSLTDTVALRTALIGWADRAIAGTDRAVHDVGQLGTAPDAAAEQSVTRMTDALTAMRAAFVDAKSIAEHADGADTAAFQHSYQQLVDRMSALPEAAQNPFAGVPGSAAVAEAATRAPNCQTPAPPAGENP